MTSEVPAFSELIATCQRSAVHLEMRDTYTPSSARYAQWRAGAYRPDPADRAQWWRPFHTTVGDAVARGVAMRRARIVSEPISDFIRYEYELTYQNIAAGEDVRWLPRRHASNLALPGNDYWLFDDHTVRFGHFAGDGELVGEELSHDPAVIKLCATAFEAVWERAIPHHDYRPS